MKSSFRQRLPVLIAIGIGITLWKTGAFGFMASERTLTWRFPVSYRDVRWLELQVWDGEALLHQQERTVEGLTSEPELKLPLSRGPHRAIARVLVTPATEPTVFQQEFDPGTQDAVVLDMKKP